MTTAQVIADLLTTMTRWAARILGLLAGGPFLLFLIFLGATATAGSPGFEGPDDAERTYLAVPFI